jgi:hypothetical protein
LDFEFKILEISKAEALPLNGFNDIIHTLYNTVRNAISKEI